MRAGTAWRCACLHAGADSSPPPSRRPRPRAQACDAQHGAAAIAATALAVQLLASPATAAGEAGRALAPPLMVDVASAPQPSQQLRVMQAQPPPSQQPDLALHQAAAAVPPALQAALLQGDQAAPMQQPAAFDLPPGLSAQLQALPDLLPSVDMSALDLSQLPVPDLSVPELDQQLLSDIKTVVEESMSATNLAESNFESIGCAASLGAAHATHAACACRRRLPRAPATCRIRHPTATATAPAQGDDAASELGSA